MDRHRVSRSARTSRLVASLVLAGIAALSWAAPARAQRGVQWSPDRSVRLINKDVGTERWAITVDAESGVVTGNVYRTDGAAPQVLWCWPQSTASDPVELRCQGSSGCDAWQDLGIVTVPASFLSPAASCSTRTEAADTSAVLAMSVSLPSTTQAVAAPSGLRGTPDARRTLISKDVGGERWAIGFDPRAQTIAGNVYDRDGEARFVYCTRDGASHDGFTCAGAESCDCAPCPASEWTSLGEIQLPGSFLEERRCSGGLPPQPGLRAVLTPSSVEPDGAFGGAVALDGDVAAVAVPDVAVYVFERDAGGWRRVARLARPEPRAPGRDADDSSGFATRVAVAGETIVVTDDDRARVYERGDGSWSRMFTLSPPETFNVWRVQVASDRLALVTSAAAGDRSTIRLYERSSFGWRAGATIPTPGRAPIEQFGTIALSRDRLAARVLQRTSPTDPFTSEILVHQRSGTTWPEMARIVSASAANGRATVSLALAGDTLAVGLSHRRGPGSAGTDDGFVLVFERNEDDTWTQRARLEGCGAEVGRLGVPLAIEGDRIVAGSASSFGPVAGDAHVFQRDEEGAWRPSGRITVAESAPTVVALSGSTLLVGTPTADAAAVLDLDASTLLRPDACATYDESWPIPDWQVAAASAHGMNPVLLEAARAAAFRPENHTQGVVIVRHGEIVAEWYEDGRDADSYAASWSMAKSVSSAVIGIAVERGLIPGVDESMATFFPAWAGSDRARITLKNVLQMTSGLDWIESYVLQQDPLSDIARLASVERDQLSYVLAKPLAWEPGTSFSYSSGDSMLLSGVIAAVTGRTMGEFAREALFDPLGMRRAQWWSDAVGHTLSYCCIDAPTREFARFGLLYARNGRWGDRQILSPDWVRASTTEVELDGSVAGYGYQWWLRGDDPTAREAMFEARGWDGQHVYVFPNLDLVVVRNGHYDKDPGPPIADPTLFARYPSAGLVAGRGTIPPAPSFDEQDFLRQIVDAVVE